MTKRKQIAVAIFIMGCFALAIVGGTLVLPLYEEFRVAQHPRMAVATVIQCINATGSKRGPLYLWEIEYDGTRSRTFTGRPMLQGQAVPLVYAEDLPHYFFVGQRAPQLADVPPVFIFSPVNLVGVPMLGCRHSSLFQKNGCATCSGQWERGDREQLTKRIDDGERLNLLPML